MAVFDEGLAGCNEESCELPSSVELLELVTYLDEELQVGDREGASEKVGEIVEAAMGGIRNGSRQERAAGDAPEGSVLRRAGSRASQSGRMRGFSRGKSGEESTEPMGPLRSLPGCRVRSARRASDASESGRTLSGERSSVFVPVVSLGRIGESPLPQPTG